MSDKAPVLTLGKFELNGEKIEVLDFIQRLELTQGELMDLVDMKVGDNIRFITGTSAPQELRRVA